MAVQVASHLKALAQFMVQIRATPSFKDVVLAQKAHFTEQLSSLTFSVTDANLVVSALQEVPWPKDVADELLALVATKTTAQGPSQALARRTLQDFRGIMHFLTAKIWSDLQGTRIDSMAKAELFIQHMVQMGLRVPSEQTFQSMAGIFLACQEGLAKACNLTPSVKHSTLKHFKSAFKRSIRCSVVQAWIPQLPATADKLKEEYPGVFASVYSENPPEPCPLDGVTLDGLINSIPMRSTNKSVTGSPFGASQEGGQMMHMMQAMLQQFTGQQPANQGGGLNIKFLGRPSCAQAALPAGEPELQIESSPQLALMAPPALVQSGGQSPVSGTIPKVSQPSLVLQAPSLAVAADLVDSASTSLSVGGQSGRYGGKAQKMAVDDSIRLLQEAIDGRPKPKPKGKAKAKAKTKYDDTDKGVETKGAGKGVETKGAGKGKAKAKAKAKVGDTGKGVEKKDTGKMAPKNKTGKIPRVDTEWSREQMQCRGASTTYPAHPTTQPQASTRARPFRFTLVRQHSMIFDGCQAAQRSYK